MVAVAVENICSGRSYLKREENINCFSVMVIHSLHSNFILFECFTIIICKISPSCEKYPLQLNLFLTFINLNKRISLWVKETFRSNNIFFSKSQYRFIKTKLNRSKRSISFNTVESKVFDVYLLLCNDLSTVNILANNVPGDGGYAKFGN